MKKIYPYAISPWEDRLQVTMKVEREMTTQWHQDLQGIIIAISSSERNGLIDIGGAICDTRIRKTQTKPFILSKTVGRETKQNLYTVVQVTPEFASSKMLRETIMSKCLSILCGL